MQCTARLHLPHLPHPSEGIPPCNVRCQVNNNHMKSRQSDRKRRASMKWIIKGEGKKKGSARGRCSAAALLRSSHGICLLMKKPDNMVGRRSRPLASHLNCCHLGDNIAPLCSLKIDFSSIGHSICTLLLHYPPCTLISPWSGCPSSGRCCRN